MSGEAWRLMASWRSEKFPALAALVEGKNEDDLTALEQVVVLYANEFRAAAETAAEEYAALRARVAELEGERDALRMLAAFAQHHPNCPDMYKRDCPCGYTDARKAVATALAGR